MESGLSVTCWPVDPNLSCFTLHLWPPSLHGCSHRESSTHCLQLVSKELWSKTKHRQWGRREREGERYGLMHPSHLSEGKKQKAPEVHMVRIKLWAHQRRVMTSASRAKPNTSLLQLIVVNQSHTRKGIPPNHTHSQPHWAEWQRNHQSTRVRCKIWREFIGHNGYTHIMHIYSIYQKERETQ